MKDPTDAEEEEEEKDKEPKFLMNDYIEKAEKEVPQDPYGAETMHADLIIKAEQIFRILEGTLLKTLTWLMAEKSVAA